MSGSEQLVYMANDIGNFFRGSADREAAILGILNHIKGFWTPQVRRKLVSDMEGGDEKLDELPPSIAPPERAPRVQTEATPTGWTRGGRARGLAEGPTPR
jgi:formate dehydrogenase subunit delta